MISFSVNMERRNASHHFAMAENTFHLEFLVFQSFSHS